MPTPPATLSTSPDRHESAPSRQDRMRAFLKNHGLSLPDVGEALADLSGSGRFDRHQVFALLYTNKSMKQPIRDRLLDLGFPEDTLPPAKPLPCFPGRATADLPATA
ncbi:hypothetical protein [Desulfovibrio sp.]|uniref:hypothetical protein n=1 Tax=Desulfovibrio sp. TaxID=885 RepID=UPI0023C87CCD|nr:hypothetical protein [Desulfovibrio sp.]MDE7241466.1 hypothetical protein [Desulfovibrio sp.]